MKIKSKYIKTALDLCSKLNPDIYIYQDDDAIVFQCIQDGNSALIECIIRTNIKKLNKIIYFPIAKVRNILNASKEDDNLEIELKDEYIIFKLNNIIRTIRLYQPDKPRFTMPDERKDEPLVFDYDFDIFADELVKPIIASSDINSNLNFNIEDKILRINKENETDKFTSEIKNIIISKWKGKINNNYSSEFIYNVVSKAKDKVNIKISQDAPIKFTNELYRNFTFKYIVAPLVEKD